MEKLQNLYQELKKHSHLYEGENTERFLETVDKIVTLQDPSSIKILLRFFDDERDYGWVLESLACALESYPDEIYTVAIIESIPFMLKHAPHWLITLIYAIFNHPPSLQYFKQNLHLIPKGDMIQLLDIITQQSEHHKELSAELKKELLGLSK